MPGHTVSSTHWLDSPMKMQDAINTCVKEGQKLAGYGGRMMLRTEDL